MRLSAVRITALPFSSDCSYIGRHDRLGFRPRLGLGSISGLSPSHVYLYSPHIDLEVVAPDYLNKRSARDSVAARQDDKIKNDFYF